MAGHAWLQAAGWVGRIVAIGPDAQEDEVCWEAGMRALVLEIEQDCDEVWIMKLDFRPFMDTNRALMTPNFYDENGVPRLTAEQAKHWSQIDTWHMPPPGKAWATRLVEGPRWAVHAPGFQRGKRGLLNLSAFASDVEAQAWYHCPVAGMDAARALADNAGFLGGAPRALAA